MLTESVVHDADINCCLHSCSFVHSAIELMLVWLWIVAVVETSVCTSHLWLRPSSEGQSSCSTDGGNVTGNDQVWIIKWI